MFEQWSFWKEAPSQVRMYPCPACHETISADAPSCRFCNLSIDAKTRQQLLAESQRVTTAITRANTFSVSTSAALLVAGIALYNLLMAPGLPIGLLAIPVIAIGWGAYWLHRNGSLFTHDPDYAAAVRKVKWTMVVWVAVLLGQLAAYLLLHGFPDWQTTIRAVSMQGEM